MRELHISPVITLQIKKTTWYGFCVRSHQHQEGHTSSDHFVLIRAPFADPQRSLKGVFKDILDIPVRIHSECLFGDVFDSDRCDCGIQLERSLNEICEADQGILIYLRQEGRGIGLYDKIRSLKINDSDSFRRNEAIGLPGDKRGYLLPSKILQYLGVRSARLMSGNPAKISTLQCMGISITPVSCIDTTNISPEALEDLISKIHRGYNY